ncbi:MAG: endonuclease MutS2 [Roseburia sp.]|nr:endonuclease MutS2 [Roseburia sp.]
MRSIYKNLEFDLILQRIAELCYSETVANKVLETEPKTDVRAASKLLTQTCDALHILASYRPITAFDDIETLVNKARVGATLQPDELLKINKSLSAVRKLKTCIDNADGCDSLKDITAYARTCDELESEIVGAVENDSDLKDRASEKLYSIRRAILRSAAKLKERLDAFTRQSEVSKYLQDNIVTLRGGRYVVPVRSECRSNVKGLVHDVSSTGATVFIEPFAVVEANNELKTLKTEEQNEIERILAQLTALVAENADELTQNQDVLIECGVIFAKAEYAQKTDAYRPILNDVGKIVLRDARHPLIERDKVVPVDIALDDKRVLLISGPNTGGKTVALKTVGLFAIMAASGILLPTNDGSEMCIFSDIFCDIGDSQSIAQSLSTFSAHVKHLSEICTDINARSLVLLDEVGDGTDPDEGAALAIAVIKKILRTSAVAVVTTHFNAVKEFALGCDGIANGCMQFDSDNFKPTYKLLQGVSGSSYALEIAEKLGLDAQIISDARAALSAEKVAFDKIMREAEDLRNAALREKTECAQIKAQADADAKKARELKVRYESLIGDVEANARIAIKRRADEYSAQADELIEQIKELLKEADDSALFNARKAAKKLEYDGLTADVKPSVSDTPADVSKLKDGTHVFVSGFGKDGTVVGVPRGGKVTVAIGSIKTELPVSSLTVIEDVRIPKKSVSARFDREPENREVMLLGKTVDEAVEILDRIISDLAPHSTLRIVHGKGSGALGKGVQSYLKRHARIKTFRYGRYGEGDTGVTIAEIK